MPVIETQFPVLGETLPSDHGYALYGALSRLVPSLHSDEPPVRIGPVSGLYEGNGRLRLDRQRSRLRLRLAAEQIAVVLPLAGRSLDVDGCHIRLGVPQVRALVPAPSLVARMVTIKRSSRQDRADTRAYMEPASFLERVRRELDKLEISGDPGIPLVDDGPHAGKPRRHVMRIKDRRVVGFGLQVTGLTAEESIRVQENGLGGRKKMGCGFFVPLRPR
ncbi:MAG: type I-MYXAN CRISPR-associated protein Cas6/Cmx6 [Gemmataceae bacterium]